MDLAIASARLVAHFEAVHAERMQGLPILNPRLAVRAVGFREFGNHWIGVLITPWFINLVLLPGTRQWSELAQGSVVDITFPGSEITFHVSQDDDIGTLLSAALFSSVADFPDEQTAVEVAQEIMERLFEAAAEKEKPQPQLSRRKLFTSLGSG